MRADFKKTIHQSVFKHIMKYPYGGRFAAAEQNKLAVQKRRAATGQSTAYGVWCTREMLLNVFVFSRQALYYIMGRRVPVTSKHQTSTRTRVLCQPYEKLDLNSI